MLRKIKDKNTGFKESIQLSLDEYEKFAETRRWPSLRGMVVPAVGAAIGGIYGSYSIVSKFGKLPTSDKEFLVDYWLGPDALYFNFAIFGGIILGGFLGNLLGGRGRNELYRLIIKLLLGLFIGLEFSGWITNFIVPL